MDELSHFRKKLLTHQIVFESVPLSCQLGIPRLHVERGQLCASFFPHRVSAEGGQWKWERPDFRLVCLYPSCKVVYFADRKYEADREAPALPSADIGTGAPCMRKLEGLCSEALRAWNEDRSTAAILRFEQERQLAAAQLGLGALWGE